jgi:hypothetical protein
LVCPPIGVWIKNVEVTETNGMRIISTIFTALVFVIAGCSTSGPKPEKGPQGTIAYYVEVESSEPGARIEVDNEYVGKTPLTLKIFGDKDGSFHNFGKFDYTITTSPVRAGQQPQTKVFKTGRLFTGEDRIPKKIFFEFGQVPEAPK